MSETERSRCGGYSRSRNEGTKRQAPGSGFELSPDPGEIVWGGCLGEALGDQLLHRSEPVVSIAGCAHPVRDETCELRIQRAQLKGPSPDRVHRRPEKVVRAERCKAHDHELALADRSDELMTVMEADNPGPVMTTRRVLPPVRSSKIQDKGDFGRRQVSFKNGLREKPELAR
jgi:hypothetical protein